MQKTVLFPLALCLAAAGCQFFKPSPTWSKVTHVARAASETAPADDYVTRLRRTLEAGAVEHRVVTFQHPYADARRGRGIATRTVVIYRDEADPRRPWWLAEHAAEKPVWLPNGTGGEGEEIIGEQLRFYAREKVDILSVEDSGSRAPFAIARELPPIPASRPTAITHLEPEPRRDHVLARTARSIGHGFRAVPSFLGIRRRDPAPAPEPAVAAAPAPAQDLTALFRERHGSPYDRGSAVDRRKMEALNIAAR